MAPMPAPIWERESAIGAIERLLDEARAGSGGTLFVVGDAGLGKTTMLELARSLGGSEFDVVLGCGDPMESSLPFGIVSQTLRDLPTGWTPVALKPPSPGAEAHAALFYEALRLLQESTERPTLLMFDDLHWTDPDSLRLATFLVRRIPSLKVAALATLRPWPQSALQASRQAVHAGYARVETLTSLSREAARRLLEDRAGRAVGNDETPRAWALAGGNPLLLEQVALSMRRGAGIPELAGGHADATARELILTRFLGVSEREMRYARAASIFGTRFEPGLVVEVAGMEQADADEALDALCSGGLVRTATGGSAEFVHPLFRQALYDDLSEPVRVRRHAQAFRTIMAHGLGSSLAAEHALRGRLIGDAEAVAALEEAGRAAMSAGAIEVSREHAGAAVELAGNKASESLLAFRAETLLASGQVVEAIPVYRRILERPNIAREAKALAHRRLAVALYVAGQASESDVELDASFQSAAADPNQAVQALLDMSAVHWITRGPTRGLEFATRARKMAHNSTPEVRARAEAAWGFCAYQCGDPAGLGALEAVARVAERDPVADLSNLDWSWGSLGMYLAVADFAERFGDSERVFQIAFDAAERVGTPMSIVALAITRAGGLVRIGKLAEALQLADRADILLDLTPTLAPWSAWIRALIFSEMGPAEASIQSCERLTQLLGDDESRLPILRLWLYHLRAAQLRREGRVADACEFFQRAERVARTARVLEPCIVPWMQEAGLAYLACDRIEDSNRILQWLEELSSPLACRWPKIAAARVRADMAERKGKIEEVLRHYDAALKWHAGLPMPLVEARTLMAYGGFLRRQSEPRRARPHFARALELAEASGAVRLAEEASQELEAAGGRRLRNKHPDELTPQESRVAALAGEGLSNEQIARAMVVSVKTVETHLHHVYDKLGISSRRELIRRATQAPR